MSYSSSRAVKFVLSMEDEKNIKSSNNLGVGHVVGIRRRFIHHVKEVFDVTKVFLRLVDGLSSLVSVASGSNSRGASEDSVDVLVSFLLSVINVSTDVSRVSFGVERRKSSHKSGHHSHRVSVMSESSDEGFKSRVVGRVLHDLSSESVQLFLSREFSKDNQERGL